MRDAAWRYVSFIPSLLSSWLQISLAALFRLFPLEATGMRGGCWLGPSSGFPAVVGVTDPFFSPHRVRVSGRVRCGGLAGHRICWVPLAAARAAHFVAVSHGVIRGRRSFLWDDTAADAVQSQGFPHSLVGLDAFPHSSVRKPRPHGGGPLGAYRGSIPAGYGTGNSRTRKFLRGCTPGTRMTLHHHPDRVATSDFENSNFEFGVWSTASITTCGNPGPMVGALGAYRGSIPPVMGRVIAAQVCIGRKRVLPETTPGKFCEGALE
ncbi:hypothetical protein PAPYR_13282 [Paratrimastix pyriformis]|uniref:Uncharacterized protein n=1 Tax=Paratrimastix pyriformis TaxID=342808 RepID=A0ABQ8U0J4_9EUKA|nr:hypothetical protein PAPYR_13282 [Paratrimastix pyriformis]